MTTVLGRGQCGGHLTLIFTVEDSHEDPYFQGSRGAGICLVDGVESIARGEDGVGKLIVNGSQGEAIWREDDEMVEIEVEGEWSGGSVDAEWKQINAEDTEQEEAA